MAAIDLCTTSDVKTELEIGSDTSRDTMIASVVTGVSRAIHSLCEREFRTESVGSTTRRFEVSDGNYFIDLAPFDLNASSGLTVTIHPTGTSYTLTANTEYLLEPANKTWTYQGIRVSPWVAQMHVGETPRRFGITLVDVTSSSWGFASVPEDVKRAAIISVCANIDRRLDAYSLAANDLVDMDAGIRPARQPAFSIPMAALVLLNPYRRNTGAF